MSNVVKIISRKKKTNIEDWKDEIEKQNFKLTDRIYDAIRLADDEAIDDSIPEEFADCAILGVLSTVLVEIADTRNIVSPGGLLKLVKEQIEEP